MSNRVLEDNIERLIRRAAPPVTETRLEAVYGRFASRCRTGASQGRRIAGVAAAAAAAVILGIALGGFPHAGNGSPTLSEATSPIPPSRAAAPGPVAAPELQAVPPPGQDPDSARVTLNLSDATVKQTLESLRASSGVPIELDEGARTRAE